MGKSVARNDLCPCGSGRKYKNCCAGKLRIRGLKFGVTTWVFLGLGAAAVVVVIMSRTSDRVAPRADPMAPTSASGPPSEPWAYDSVAKRHYDPGHGHWHDGPPPPPAARGLATPTAPATAAPPPDSTPPPWTFDPAGNRHWDPIHGHWHPGPPPQGVK